MRKLIIIADKLSSWLVFFLLLVVWETGVRIAQVPEWILPGPWQVMSALKGNLALIYYHTQTTLGEAGLGFILSILLAFAAAFALTSLPWLNRAVYPFLIISQTIPLIVLAVLFTIWFGWGLLPKVLIVILVCFFPIAISLINGLNSVDPDQISLFRSMGASQLATFNMVKLPAAMPSFFSGLKISATYSIMAAVIGEWLGAKQGLGYYMTLQQKSFAIDQVLAAVVVICVISLILVQLVGLLERILVPWNFINDNESTDMEVKGD